MNPELNRWSDLLIKFLHDPPDKALDITQHESRARALAAAALRDVVSREDLKDPSDVLAATAERLPAPGWGTLTVPYAGDADSIRHPMSGQRHPQPHRLHVREWTTGYALRRLESLLDGVEPVRSRFLLLWRRWPEELADAEHPWFAHLPADTRIPDHSIWHHLDTTAGLKGAEVDSARSAAFLSFAIGPVQSFIAAARSVRDLWSGSMILSWLTFQAMLPIVDQLGPTALVYPSLRGLPWLDRWLRDQPYLREKIQEPPEDQRRSPCLPNRFLALVPWGPDGQRATLLADQCQAAARHAWSEIADAVRRSLDEQLRPLHPQWSARWQQQIDDFFEIRTAVLPWSECRNDDALGNLIAGRGGFPAAFPDAARVRSLADAIPDSERPGYDQKVAGRWQARVELSARLMQSLRSVRPIPRSTVPEATGEMVPPKCSLLGTYEQMGPAGLADSDSFWNEAQKRVSIDGVRLRTRERLSAVALVKRFAGPCFFAGKLELPRDELRYHDTATVAAAEWLEQAGISPDRIRKQHDGWSGQWLHWSRPDAEAEDPCPAKVFDDIRASRQQYGRPPAYLAVLMIDGDRLGSWLRGEKSPAIQDVIHGDLRKYFEKLPAARDGLAAKRPVGPALHAAISEALANFALHFVPAIIRRYRGTLIYAGGDDVLALLPTATALACARELRETFHQNWAADENGRERLLMGGTATVSAGLAVVHYKEDLRFAIGTARAAEKAAKSAGRDALQLAVCRRSGEHSSTLCPWELTGRLGAWVTAFQSGDVSDRWAYHLRGELPTLQAVPLEAMQAEIVRQLRRAEKKTVEHFPPADIAAAFVQYHEWLASRADRRQGAGSTSPATGAPQQELAARALTDFVTLCQSASFLARGRDE